MSEAEAGPRQQIPVTTSMPLSGKVKVAFLSLSLLAVVAAHVPLLPLTVQAVGHAFANVVGQEHRWNMFSADPRGTSLNLWVEVVYEDGAKKEWRIDRHRVGGDFAYYHWVKWMETAVLEPNKARLDGLAGWLAAVSPAPVDEVIVYGEQRLGVPPGQPLPPSEVAQLGHFTAETWP